MRQTIKFNILTSKDLPEMLVSCPEKGGEVLTAAMNGISYFIRYFHLVLAGERAHNFMESVRCESLMGLKQCTDEENALRTAILRTKRIQFTLVPISHSNPMIRILAKMYASGDKSSMCDFELVYGFRDGRSVVGGFVTRPRFPTEKKDGIQEGTAPC